MDVWTEYDAAADWCARRGLNGKEGDPLPTLLSVRCLNEIDTDPEAFERRVRGYAYALAMSKYSPQRDSD
jgi:hypothetical protein